MWEDRRLKRKMHTQRRKSLVTRPSNDDECHQAERDHDCNKYCEWWEPYQSRIMGPSTLQVDIKQPGRRGIKESMIRAKVERAEKKWALSSGYKRERRWGPWWGGGTEFSGANVRPVFDEERCLLTKAGDALCVNKRTVYCVPALHLDVWGQPAKRCLCLSVYCVYTVCLYVRACVCVCPNNTGQLTTHRKVTYRYTVHTNTWTMI